MKIRNIRGGFIMMAISLLFAMEASATTTYLLKVTNGTLMPISPAVIYVKNGQVSKAPVGGRPTEGFVELCQMGKPVRRSQELAMDSSVKSISQTSSPIMPGASQTVEVSVEDPMVQSIHLETMYGKTKDLCAVGSFNSHSLYALKQHVTSEVLVKDNALQSGAFLSPMLPMGHSYPDMNLCSQASNAVSCLRELARPNNGEKKIRFFSSYLPSVVQFLEKKYGASETNDLLLPSSGGVELELKLKH